MCRFIGSGGGELYWDHAYGLVLGLFCPTGHQVVSGMIPR